MVAVQVFGSQLGPLSPGGGLILKVEGVLSNQIIAQIISLVHRLSCLGPSLLPSFPLDARNIGKLHKDARSRLLIS